MIGMVCTYKGRPITELDKPELIEALDYAIRELERERQFARSAIDMESRFIDAAHELKRAPRFVIGVSDSEWNYAIDDAVELDPRLRA